MLEVPTHWGTVAKKVTEVFQKQVQRNVQRKDTIKKSWICLFFHHYNKQWKLQILQTIHQKLCNHHTGISWNMRRELFIIISIVKFKTCKATQYFCYNKITQLLED